MTVITFAGRQDFWYGVEPPHFLVKYDNGVTVFTGVR